MNALPLACALAAMGPAAFAAAGPAAEYLENEPRRERPVTLAPWPEPGAAESRPRDAFLPRDPASQRYREAASRMAPARPAPGPDADQVRAEAAEDYERRILGAKALPEPNQLPAPQPPVPASTRNELFVAVDFAGEGDLLKDSVADFSRNTGFRADARFPAEPLPYHSAVTVVRGWVPTTHLGDAFRAPGVLRVQIEHSGPRPSGAEGAKTSVLVSLRVPAGADAGRTLERVLGELAEQARLRWTKTIGFQPLAAGDDVALVIVGELPITRLSRLLAHPSVLKVGAAPDGPASAPRAAAPAPASERGRAFLRYVRDKSPLLLLVTLLALLPSAGYVLARAIRTFIPYH